MNRPLTVREQMERTMVGGDRSGSNVIDGLPSIWRIRTIPSWLVDGLIPDASVVMLTGAAGIGKSTLVLALAGCVAHGRAFLGRNTEQRPVLLLDRENPAWVVRERIDRLGIAETPRLKVWGGWCESQPAGPDSRAVVEWVRAHRPLVIVDSVIAFLDGDEQSATDVRRNLQHFRNLASLGATCVILHHRGKGESPYRGSSDYAAAIDLGFSLERVDDSIDGIGDLKLVPFKSRGHIARAIRIAFCGDQFEQR